MYFFFLLGGSGAYFYVMHKVSSVVKVRFNIQFLRRSCVEIGGVNDLVLLVTRDDR